MTRLLVKTDEEEDEGMEMKANTSFHCLKDSNNQSQDSVTASPSKFTELA